MRKEYSYNKKEYIKCEKLLETVIIKANDPNSDYKAYEQMYKEGKKIDAECKLRLADQELVMQKECIRYLLHSTLDMME